MAKKTVRLCTANIGSLCLELEQDAFSLSGEETFARSDDRRLFKSFLSDFSCSTRMSILRVLHLPAHFFMVTSM